MLFLMIRKVRSSSGIYRLSLVVASAPVMVMVYVVEKLFRDI